MRNMNNNLARLIIILSVIIIPYMTHADTYPEFTGNYIKCGNGWCDIQRYELHTMLLNHWVGNDRNLIGYAGFFEIPKDVPKTKENKPRILVFSGRAQADPLTVALVELGKLPYNVNDEVFSVNGQNYGGDPTQIRYNKGNLRYTKDYVKNQLWVFKREIPLKFKPVEGRVGMFLYEPAEPLSDGIYVVDSGTLKAGSHVGLTTAPAAWDIGKTQGVQLAIPFIVGKVNENKMIEKTEPSVNSTKPPSVNSANDQAQKSGQYGATIGEALINSLFGK